MSNKKHIYSLRKKYLLNILLLFFSFSLFKSWALFAQDRSEQLVFTKAMLDSKTNQIWFEVFNPSAEDIRLSSFRISGVKTINILPPNIRINNGVIINSSDRLIICSNKYAFEEQYGKNFKIIEINQLDDLNDGGFVIMNHLEGIENEKNIIRFGDFNKSSEVSKIVSDEQVLDFSSDGKCYTRDFNSSGELTIWTKTIPTLVK